MDPRIRIHPKMSWIRNTGFDFDLFTDRTELCFVWLILLLCHLASIKNGFRYIYILYRNDLENKMSLHCFLLNVYRARESIPRNEFRQPV
jgi:hypothetical protein